MKDEDKLNDEEDFKPFIWAIIRRGKLGRQVENLSILDEDDLYQQGWLLLQEVKGNFEKVKGYEFTVYAWSYISTKLMNYIEHEARKANHKACKYEEGMEESKNKVPTKLNEIKKKFEGLDDVNLKIVDYVGSNYIQQEIGNKLGISQEAVSKRLQYIKKKLERQGYVRQMLTILER